MNKQDLQRKEKQEKCELNEWEDERAKVGLCETEDAVFWLSVFLFSCQNADLLRYDLRYIFHMR